MGASADQEEVAHVLAAVVRTEPGALRQDRLDPESRAAKDSSRSRKSIGVVTRDVAISLVKPGRIEDFERDGDLCA